MSFALIVFDFDGPCEKSLDVSYGVATHVFKLYGVKKIPPIEVYRDEITSDFMQFYWRHGVPKSATVEYLNGIRQWYFSINSRGIRLQRGLLKLMQSARTHGTRIAIVSAGSFTHIKERLRNHRLTDHVQYIIGNASDKAPALQQTLRYFQIGAPAAVYVDDCCDGIVAAKKVGMRSIGFTDGFHTREKLLSVDPDFTAHTIPQVAKIVLNGHR